MSICCEHSSPVRGSNILIGGCSSADGRPGCQRCPKSLMIEGLSLCHGEPLPPPRIARVVPWNLLKREDFSRQFVLVGTDLSKRRLDVETRGLVPFKPITRFPCAGLSCSTKPRSQARLLPSASLRRIVAWVRNAPWISQMPRPQSFGYRLRLRP